MNIARGRIILDLCGGTGAWSQLYRGAGYDVRLVTLPRIDVLSYRPPAKVHGILAAPPCDHFSVSGAQYWKAKDADGRTAGALSIVDACLNIISNTDPVWWAMENPVGRLKKLRPGLGEPALIFDPCDFGDAYTKKNFTMGPFQSTGEDAGQTRSLVFPGFVDSETWREIGANEDPSRRHPARICPRIFCGESVAAENF